MPGYALFHNFTSPIYLFIVGKIKQQSEPVGTPSIELVTCLLPWNEASSLCDSQIRTTSAYDTRALLSYQPYRQLYRRVRRSPRETRCREPESGGLQPGSAFRVGDE